MPLRNPSQKVKKGFASPLRASASHFAAITPCKPFVEGFMTGTTTPLQRYSLYYSILLYATLFR